MHLVQSRPLRLSSSPDGSLCLCVPELWSRSFCAFLYRPMLLLGCCLHFGIFNFPARLPKGFRFSLRLPATTLVLWMSAGLPPCLFTSGTWWGSWTSFLRCFLSRPSVGNQLNGQLAGENVYSSSSLLIIHKVCTSLSVIFINVGWLKGVIVNLYPLARRQRGSWTPPQAFNLSAYYWLVRKYLPISLRWNSPARLWLDKLRNSL